MTRTILSPRKRACEYTLHLIKDNYYLVIGNIGCTRSPEDLVHNENFSVRLPAEGWWAEKFALKISGEVFDGDLSTKEAEKILDRIDRRRTTIRKLFGIDPHAVWQFRTWQQKIYDLVTEWPGRKYKS